MIHENRQEEVIIDLKLTFIARFLVHKKQDEIKSIVKAGILERKVWVSQSYVTNF